MQFGDLDEGTESATRRSRSGVMLWVLLGFIALAFCFACLVTIIAAGILLVSQSERSGGELSALPSVTVATLAPPLPTHAPQPTLIPTATALPSQEVPEADGGIVTATIPAATSTPAIRVPAEIKQEILPDSAFQHLSALLAADYPARDYFETANRLGRTEVGQRTVVAQSYQIGDRENFITDDGVREAVLMAVTEHAYFWVESNLDYDQEQVVRAAQRFESEYFPAVAKLYGMEWQNGIDDDPRFSALHLNGYAEGTELGFFNSGDQYPRSVNTSSNEQEVIYLNMENLRPGEPLYFGTLVHEFQHLIQWRNDPNEPVWLSEGLAQFTELYVGLDTVDTSFDYLSAPGTRLNTWLHDAGDEIFAHYGAAYLFVVYFWEQFGDQAIQELMQHPADGLAGFSAVLAERDPLVSLDQFVLDWATANYLDNEEYGPGYSYEHLSLESPEHRDEVTESPYEAIHEIEQYGVSYINVDLKGEHTLAFAGNSTAELITATPHSGTAMWYVPALDELDAQLTTSFDLAGLTEANLNFWAWYDLEEGFDFAYMSASADGGTTWDLLLPTHAEAGEFGPALTGRSEGVDGNRGGWVNETVSLSAYAGGSVLIRFEVLSDSAIAEAGFAIDDISIPELNYHDDAETGTGSWQARGFVRTGHQVPQIWRLNLILPGPSPQILALDLADEGQGKWTIDFGDQGGVLVITAQTPFVSDPTSYWLAVDPQE